MNHHDRPLRWHVRAGDAVDAGMPDTWYGRAAVAVCAAATGLVLTVVMPTVLGVLLLAGVAVDMRRCLSQRRPGAAADETHRRRRGQP